MTERICSVEGCEGISGGPGTARGFCESHYRRWRIYGDPLVSKQRRRTFCSIGDCERPCVGHGWCEFHYRRWKRFGDPLDPGPRASLRPNGLRRCTTCKEEKPLFDFYEQPPGRRPLYSCKECSRATARRYATAAVHRRRARIAAAPSETFTNGEVFERDGWMCGICGSPIDPLLAWPDPMSASLDHINPIALGGGHVLSNVQASHLACNLHKHAKAPAAM